MTHWLGERLERQSNCQWAWKPEELIRQRVSCQANWIPQRVVVPYSESDRPDIPESFIRKRGRALTFQDSEKSIRSLGSVHGIQRQWYGVLMSYQENHKVEKVNFFGEFPDVQGRDIT